LIFFDFFTDIDGPYIFADRESPLLASSTVELTCLVYTDGTKYDTLELIWDCFTKSQPVSDFTNSSMVMSTLSINGSGDSLSANIYGPSISVKKSKKIHVCLYAYHKSNTMGPTSGAVTAYPSGAPVFTPGCIVLFMLLSHLFSV
jgi:hypothetical protein